ncbi:MAG: hypothetical protein QFX38_01900 [Methanothermobacter sp.]|nr:hypothetical protein [Methanothermobacter sp.]
MRTLHTLTPKIITPLLILLLLNPVYPASSATQDVTVTVTETIQIKTIWNGKETTNPFTFNVYIGSWGEYYWPGEQGGLQIKSLSNIPIDLYVKAEGDLQGPIGIIPIENLKYADYGACVPKTSFKKDYVLVKEHWKVENLEEAIIPVDLYLNIPPGTPPGIYSVKIYHIAVKSQ